MPSLPWVAITKKVCLTIAKLYCYNAVPMPYSAMLLCNAMLPSIMLCFTLPYYYAMLCYAPCFTMLCFVVICSAVLCCTLL